MKEDYEDMLDRISQYLTEGVTQLVTQYEIDFKNCQEIITSKFASAEHTLSDDESLFSYCDEMFSGVFCCHECYDETAGINLSYLKGYEHGEVNTNKLWQDKLDEFEKKLFAYFDKRNFIGGKIVFRDLKGEVFK